MQDISGFGLRINILASTSFPAGFVVTQFADDSDPLDAASIQIADTAMGLNGDLLKWARAVTLPLVISVVPDGEDDRNLSVLFENNRVGKGKLSARDLITATLVYPGGRVVQYFGGVLTNGMSGNSIASAGRLKSKTYTFAFENKAGT